MLSHRDGWAGWTLAAPKSLYLPKYQVKEMKYAPGR